MLLRPEDTITCLYRNERDIEIPALTGSIRDHLNDINSFIDIGAHWSHAFYAPGVKNILVNRVYDAVDILSDDLTSKIVDHYFIGNVCEPGFQLESYDYVACVSVIEHCGLTTYKENNYRNEQYKLFDKLTSLAKKYLFLSFPFGLDDIYPGQLANITNTQLYAFEYMAAKQGLHLANSQFYFNEFAPGGEPWYLISREEAATKPMIKEKGTQCIGIVEFTK